MPNNSADSKPAPPIEKVYFIPLDAEDVATKVPARNLVELPVELAGEAPILIDNPETNVIAYDQTLYQHTHGCVNNFAQAASPDEVVAARSCFRAILELLCRETLTHSRWKLFISTEDYVLMTGASTVAKRTRI